ncbi:hypothetical protein QNN00_17790 [Bacillus velezensis]|nr:hypothetical protein [Bacillus velezensis]
MDETFINNLNKNKFENEEFKNGFRAGAEYKDQMEKRIRDLESVFA